jgi:PAS domain S-box-containing protein
VQQLSHSFKAQREALRQKGMDLPPPSVRGIETVQQELETIAQRITDQANEIDRLRTLADTTFVINATLDLAQTLSAIMDTVLELTKAERGFIVLNNPHSGQLEIQIARGLSQDSPDAYNLSRSIVEQVYQTGQPVTTGDAQADQRFSNNQSIVGLNLRSVLCIPLVIKGAVEGVVYADSSAHRALFSNKELQLLIAIANQSALAIENARLFQQARVTLQDITEAKILLSNILDSIANGVITADQQQIITTYNLGAESILRQTGQEISGRPLAQAMPALYESIQGLLPAVYEYDQATKIDIETEVQDGDWRHLNLRLSPLKDAEQRTQGVALVVDDLTEVRRRDATLAAVRTYLPPAMVDNIKDIEKIALGGERRHITVLFVEVLPFAALQSRLEAHHLMDLLNIYLTAGTEAIHRRSGLIDKYMGSEIMALFNTQLNPSEDHPADALRAALEMIYDFEALAAQYQDPHQQPYFRIGIHTGEATLGNVGGSQRREFTALGDTVNLAKRLQENATPGQLFISGETFHICQSTFQGFQDFEVFNHGTLQVKGRVRGVEVHEIRPRRA